MDQHTPGPWQSFANYLGHDSYVVRVLSNGSHWMLSRTLDMFCGPSEAAANGRLIAAAPDLLAACEQALALLGATEPELRVMLEAAVHKAYKGVT